MVFCNTLDSCRATEHYLRERGVPTLCYHGDVPLDGRRDAIATFSRDEPSAEGHPVLVCTDLAARSAPSGLMDVAMPAATRICSSKKASHGWPLQTVHGRDPKLLCVLTKLENLCPGVRNALAHTRPHFTHSQRWLSRSSEFEP